MCYRKSIFIIIAFFIYSSSLAIFPWSESFSGSTTDSLDSSWTLFDGGAGGSQGFDGNGNWVISHPASVWSNIGINRIISTGDFEKTVTISTIEFDPGISSQVRIEIWDVRDTTTWNWGNPWHGIVIDIEHDLDSTEHILFRRRNGSGGDSNFNTPILSDVTTNLTYPLNIKILWSEISNVFTAFYGLDGLPATNPLGTVSDYILSSDTNRISQISIIRFPPGSPTTGVSTIAKIDQYDISNPPLTIHESYWRYFD